MEKKDDATIIVEEKIRSTKIRSTKRKAEI